MGGQIGIRGIDRGRLRGWSVLLERRAGARRSGSASPMTAQELRADFGAHLEANYQQLVAQLYAITLDADRAHEFVQDAYSRAWLCNWAPARWFALGRRGAGAL